MANILGKYLIKASDEYKRNKKESQSFEEFFVSKYPPAIFEKQEVYDLIEDFIFNKVNPKGKTFSDNELEILLDNLHKNLIEIEAVNDDFNVGELIGYILLGNVLNSKWTTPLPNPERLGRGFS